MIKTLSNRRSANYLIKRSAQVLASTDTNKEQKKASKNLCQTITSEVTRTQPKSLAGFDFGVFAACFTFFPVLY